MSDIRVNRNLVKNATGTSTTQQQSVYSSAAATTRNHKVIVARLNA